jgi:uncharacterized membrane protein YbhN (UPF0104 family)
MKEAKAAGTGPRRLLWPVIKTLVALGLLAWIATKVDFGRAFGTVRLLSMPVVAAVFTLLALQALLSAWRWAAISALAGPRLPLKPAFHYFMASLFYNQALPSPIPGDAARIVGATRWGLTLGEATLGVLLDRVLTLFGLLILAFAGLVAMKQVYGAALPVPHLLELMALGILAGVVAVLVLAIRPRVIAPLHSGRLAAVSEVVARLFGSRAIVLMLLITLVIHGLSVAAVYALASGLGLPLSIGAAVCAVPAVLLIAVFPVSIGGWGVREGGMIMALAAFGIGSTDAATLSVVFGLFQLVVGLAGGVFVVLPSSGRTLAGH